MSKKKLKKGLESLFGDWGTPMEDTGVLELVNAEEPTPPSSEIEFQSHSKKDEDPKTTSGKNFTSDLDTLFQEAMQESLKEQMEKKQKKKQKKKKVAKKLETRQKRKVIPRSGGLDSLIRSTIEDSIIRIEPDSQFKRVSFVFDKEKLKKLKSIAKIKKSYLKDIIDEVVAEYLAEFEQNHGKVE